MQEEAPVQEVEPAQQEAEQDDDDQYCTAYTPIDVLIVRSLIPICIVVLQLV